MSVHAKSITQKEALALLKKSIYHTAPITHETIPRMKRSDVIRAAFDPDDDPVRPPRQSVSEQQVRTHIIPMHGLRIWDVLVGYGYGTPSPGKYLTLGDRYFMRESTKKAANGSRHVTEAIKNTGGKMGIIDREKTTASSSSGVDTGSK